MNDDQHKKRQISLGYVAIALLLMLGGVGYGTAHAILYGRGLPAAMATGDVEVEGGVLQVPAVLSFLSLFR